MPVLTDLLLCLVCERPFNFARGESAVILRHVAYGYDFVHEGACLSSALSLLFVEPGYDTAAFAHDPVRERVVGTEPAAGISALARTSTGSETALPLQCWALVQWRNGSIRREGIIRDLEWLNEPGAAEFPEAWTGSQQLLAYVSPSESTTLALATAA